MSSRIIYRHSLRRQSARFKPENPEPTEDFFEIDDAKFAVSHLCDNMSEKSGPTTSSVTSGKENKENIECKFDPREIRRSSVGRPLRRTVEKVQSYKEVPINVKMRRPNWVNFISVSHWIIINFVEKNGVEARSMISPTSWCHNALHCYTVPLIFFFNRFLFRALHNSKLTYVLLWSSLYDNILSA